MTVFIENITLGYIIYICIYTQSSLKESSVDLVGKYH